jgi:hypothetical protein
MELGLYLVNKKGGTMTDILPKIMPELPLFAKKHGFIETSASYYPESFGDAEVLLDSNAFRLRVTRDRGEIFLDVAPPGTDEWHKLEYLLEFTDPDIKAEDFGIPPNSTKLLLSLEKCLSKVQEVLRDEQKRWKLNEFEKRGKEALMTKLLKKV